MAAANVWRMPVSGGVSRHGRSPTSGDLSGYAAGLCGSSRSVELGAGQPRGSAGVGEGRGHVGEVWVDLSGERGGEGGREGGRS